MNTPKVDLIKTKAKEIKSEIKPITTKYKFYDSKTKLTETRERVIRSGKEGNSFKRMTIIMLLIVFELVLLFFLYTRFILSFMWFLFIPYSLGIILAGRVAVSNKNADSKIAWILFLLIFAPVAIIVYLLAGEITASPLKSRRLKKINENTKFLKQTTMPLNLLPRIKQDCTYIQNASGFTPYGNNSTKYFSMGETFFEDVLIELDKAKKFIFMDFFILEEGHLSSALFEILIKKASEGIDIRIIVDGLGSHNTLSYLKIKKIRKYGIKITAFEPVIPIINFFVNYRNHRKIIVIDGQVGYVGGTNIADEYINVKEKFGTWKDASLRIDGGAVKSLSLMFLRMWEYSTKEKINYHSFLDNSKCIEYDNNSIVIPYGDGVNEGHTVGKNVYRNIISNAKDYIYIMSPYFIVDSDIIEALKIKAQSGVDVRLIIPGIPDKKIVYALTMSNAEKLLSSGVKIYTYSPGFLHSKVMLSDDECAVVGSINMDFRSFYQQYESAAYINETETLQSIKDDFIKTFCESKEIDLKKVKKHNIIMRFLVAFIRLFAPLM